MQYIYILYSVTHNKFYIGETDDLHRRLAQHNRGNVSSTSPYTPWTVVWSDQKATRKEALVLERKLKNLRSPARIVEFIKKYGQWDFPDYYAAFESSDDS